MLSLRKWNPEEEWPEVSTHTLLVTNEEWLGPYLNDVKKPDDLKRIDLLSILNNTLEWEKQKELNRLAPTSIEVPSGSTIKINYPAPGEPPIIAVRLQEVFGMADTPRVNNGKTNCVLHLLSPGYKPVQITSDLKSFWSNAYFEVRKDLKRRYPKHSWPDDPWTAEAVRGVKRKK
ncbi:MAG: ATP-dependent helicase hrpB [Cyclobacteriaceae bacterium]|nr:ATP-dependent helicase hrpB [Cyclobacteriaceae bacterium]